jgi:Metal binding domain of Ada
VPGIDEPVATPKLYVLLGPDRRPYPSPTPGRLGGHSGSKIYGLLDCPAALRTIARGGYLEHRVFFADEATAISAGYRPCGACTPEKYRAWMQNRGGLNARD